MSLAILIHGSSSLSPCLLMTARTKNRPSWLPLSRSCIWNCGRQVLKTLLVLEIILVLDEDRVVDCGELAMPLRLRAFETVGDGLGSVVEVAVAFWPVLCTTGVDIWDVLIDRLGMMKPPAVIVSEVQSCIS